MRTDRRQTGQRFRTPERTKSMNQLKTTGRIHIRDQEGAPLCGDPAPLCETLPDSSVQPEGQPDSYNWAEDRLAKAFACSPCRELRPSPGRENTEGPRI